MSANEANSSDYKSLSNAKKSGVNTHDQASLKPLETIKGNGLLRQSSIELQENGQNLLPNKQNQLESFPKANRTAQADFVVSDLEKTKTNENDSNAAAELPYSEQQKLKKKEKKAEKDRRLLSTDRWLIRNGHTLTFVGLYLFSIMVFFRPYEIVPGLGFLKATAIYFAVATLIFYIPAQFATEGNLTVLSTEVKAILALALIALVTIPIAKDPKIAWDQFYEPFVKAVLIFVVMVNVLRTRRRLIGLMWLSFAIGIYLSYTAIDLYARGEFAVEDYRIAVNIGGMFENPNDMALHFVIITPLTIALAIASKNNLWRIVYFLMSALFVAANMVTFSRGGFLGLLVSSIVLAWKFGRKYRLNVTIASIVTGTLVILLAPGNYGLRMLSIFIPGLDPVGSSDQRRELLERSIIVTLRNPWGIGIGNFPIVGVQNLVTHNAYTQVSAELGILGLAAYLIFMISPFRKLGAIERTLFAKNENNWFFYLSIGLQASIVGYLVTSFFASVAYNWFIYYLIAYAVALRRIYQIENGLKEEVKADSFTQSFWNAKTA
ncbi:MAG TPA: O-antigen ligase family protein [Pyrinomonadaceae bacterium]|jgi:O-antigen ligase